MDPILRVVDPYKDYTICTDASKEGLGEYYLKKGMWHVMNLAN